jgi:hypothetical protein
MANAEKVILKLGEVQFNPEVTFSATLTMCFFRNTM